MSSLELVRLLTRRVPGMALLLVVAFRSVDAGDSGLLQTCSRRLRAIQRSSA